MHSPRPTFPFAMPSPSSPPARSPTSSPTPAKSRRRTSSLALGLLALKSKDSSVHHPHDAMPPPPLRPPRDPRRSMTVDPRSSLALALMEDEPPMPQPVAPMRAKVRPSTADSVEQGAAGVQLRNSRSSASSRFMPKNGTRCPPSSVPYPRSYDRDVVDHDVWENEFFHELCGSVTWHDFKTPPKKVLDLGCGTGAWILTCARLWKDSDFVGLDIVPLQPDLELLGSDLAPRIKWVNANFLERLPFDDEEFDFVHIRRIARGVPETKWDDLFEEIARVMKKGAAFEIIEEDLNFPGSADFPTPHTEINSPSIAGPSRTARPGTASSKRSVGSMAPMGGNTHGKPLVNPHDHSELERIYTEMHAARWINVEVLSLLSSMLVLHFVDVRSHAPVHIAFPARAPAKPYKTESSSRSDPLRTGASSSPNVSPVVSKRELSRSRSGPLVPPRPDAPAADIASAVPPRLRGQSVSKVPVLPAPTVVVPQASTSAPPPSPSASPTSQRPSPKLTIPVTPASSPTPSSPFSTQPYPPGSMVTGAKLQRAHTLPNTNWNFDPGSLPLHLSLRVAEVRACFEAMWDWLVSTGQGTDDPTGMRAGVEPEPGGAATGTRRWNERQAAALVNRGASVVVGGWVANPGVDKDATGTLGFYGATVVSMASGGSGAATPSGAVILGPDGLPLTGIYTPRGNRRLTTRYELERLVDRFEMDMHDHIALSGALASKLDWQGPRDHPTPADRKAFDESVALWEDYVQQLSAQPGELQQAAAPEPLKLSRTVRAFVAWKAS